MKSKQIWIVADPSRGKSTLARLIRNMFPERTMLEIAAGQSRAFSGQAFTKAADGDIWLEDEWTPEKLHTLQADQFNKITEGDKTVTLAVKYSLQHPVKASIHTILMTNYKGRGIQGPNRVRCANKRKVLPVQIS